jgi:transposase
MKNKMLKGAHLSERKSREIVNLFCEDLTATQIAEITGVSRVTINAYLKMIRTKLAHHCDSTFPTHQLPENYLLSGQQPGDFPKTTYYGFTRWNGLVYSAGLSDLDRDSLVQWQQPAHAEAGPMATIHAVADFSNWRLYRRDAGSNGRHFSDEISGFWGLTRNRLLKFRGLNRNTLYLHIKECEYRFNNRNGNMEMSLLQMINKTPLQTLQLQS